MTTGKKIDQLVFTVKDRCRVCYTCVRSCPAKAIRIVNGQAEVINKRCIGCGNCTRVCSQGAKIYLDSTQAVNQLLSSGEKVIAMVAPSFPAEFTELASYKVLVGMIKKMGFYAVNEIAFGADVVAKRYKELFEQNTETHYISANCPAVIHYIRQYHPNLIDRIAPIASPAVAMSRILRKIHGEDVKIVMIGPCIAKKSESPEIDETLTFAELRRMLSTKQINAENVDPIEFDDPVGGRGAVFPVSRGMFQTVEIHDNVLHANIIVAEGKKNFQEALKEYEAELISNNHLELLCCEGCIMGPGMSFDGRPYSRRKMVSEYAREKLKKLNIAKWQKYIQQFKDIDLSQTYEINDQRLPQPSGEEVVKVLEQMGKFKPADHLNCGACGYETCYEHAVAIVEGLAENEMCLPYAIEQLHASIQQLDISNAQLLSAQQALKQSEKLANMGQLSAGIAHELNNPLGVVIMYANILLDETPPDSPVRDDLKLIVEQADRCKKIVGGLLNFARKNQVNAKEININELVNQSIKSILIPDNIKVKIETLSRDLYAELDHEQMMQVLTNLCKNAIEAMPEGGELTITTKESGPDVQFLIKDTGTGIKSEDMEKVFEPFFTTKPIGKGTGLGLATAYGIIKMHQGKIQVESNADPNQGPTGTKFTITLPRKR